jgi:hypothetical protein
MSGLRKVAASCRPPADLDDRGTAVSHHQRASNNSLNDTRIFTRSKHGTMLAIITVSFEALGPD